MPCLSFGPVYGGIKVGAVTPGKMSCTRLFILVFDNILLLHDTQRFIVIQPV